MENKDINHPIWGYHISGNPYMRIYIVYLDIWKPWHKQFHTMCIAGCVYNISYCTRNNVWKTSNPISHDPSSFSPFQWPVWGILSLRQNQILYYCWYIYISGWWLTYPSEKYESPSGWLFPYIMENKKCLKPPTSTIMLGTDHDCGRWEPRYIYIYLSLSPSLPLFLFHRWFSPVMAQWPQTFGAARRVTQFDDGQITGLGEQSLLTEEIVGLADDEWTDRGWRMKQWPILTQHLNISEVCPIFQSKFQTMCIFSASQGARSPIQTTPQNDRKCIWNCQMFHNEFHNVPHNHSEMSGTANQQIARLVQTTLRAGETPTQQENDRTTNVNGGWKDKISHQFLRAEPCFAHWFGPSVSTVDLPSRW